MKFREDIKHIRLVLIAITYFVLLIFLVINFKTIHGSISQFLNLLTPFFYGIGIAYVANIPMKKIEALIKDNLSENNIIYKQSRSISILLSFILVFAFIFLFGSIIIPQLFNTIANLFVNLAVFINGIINNLDQLFNYFNIDPIDVSINSNNIEQMFANIGLDWNSITKNLNNVLSSLSTAGISAIDIITNFTVQLGFWFMGFMLSIYLLASKETFIRQSKKLIAAVFDYDTTTIILRVMKKANEIFTNFVGGQLIEALIIGGLIYIALLIFKMPYAILIAALVAIMALVPVLGATLACVIGFILVFSVSPIKAIWFVIIYQVIQQAENTIIYPKVVGKSVGLPGIWTLLSSVVFGGLFGVLGMLLAVPTTACIYTFGSEIVNSRLKKKNLTVTDAKVIKNDIKEKEDR